MRIQQLNLLRYGKFTDQPLSFPHSRQDFHLIVGANEAGKSTTRSAILDLLYGIETRSSLDFLHAKSEMRLGAAIEHDEAVLTFIRSKARTKSLQKQDGGVLADSALANFLGGADRAFFDQMFGLDHGRLEAGGNAILSASNDIGQILFQSASGIGSLGTVRDQLDAEAEKLWARRRSGDRAYYQASDELKSAEDALKLATVRTKDWMEARTKVQDIEERRELSLGRYRGFEAERIRLERMRRVAPVLRQLSELQFELTQLGDVIVLPQDAARRLGDSQLELASAERDLQIYADQTKQSKERLQLIHLDERLLKYAADIQVLADRRQQVRNHEHDIDRRQLEISVHWQQVQAQVRQLGWPTVTEESLTELLPALLARTCLSGLIKRYGVIDQGLQVALSAVIEKSGDLASLDAQLKEISVSSVPPALRAALISARSLGDITVSTSRDEALLAKARRELSSSLVGLGDWAPDLGALRSLVLPVEADVGQRQKREADLKLTRRSLADKQSELRVEISSLDLEITQYRNAHHPVSQAELAAVRNERDTVWRTIKSGDKQASELAEDFEHKLATADNVADQRHDKAREVSELQSKLDALERLKQQDAENTTRQKNNDAELLGSDEQWAAQTAALGLVAMPLDRIDHWRAARDKVLAAEDAVISAQHSLLATQQTKEAAVTALRAALGGAKIEYDPQAAFDTLVLIASDAVDGVTEAKARQDSIYQQRESVATTLSRQREKADSAQAEFNAWQAAWVVATTQVNLPENIDVSSAESALSVMAEIDAKLASINDVRKSRIETMQYDLREFEQAVAATVAAAAADLVGQAAGTVVTELTARLTKALDDKKDADRLKRELEANESQLMNARARVDRAKALLLPLLQLAQVSTHDELLLVITRSDRHQSIQNAAASAKKILEEGGDGLSLDALTAEVAVTDAAQIPVQLAEVAAQIELLRQEQEGLTTELTHATTQLGKIGGQDDAARAESDRQGALAKMANAADRYIKVYTASRLLKWAIDRYRETKQGPMLTRAGEIFSALTLGSFQKLTVISDSEPLQLLGVRAEGGQVGIAGMSDGTRDQLYLALRLAALELHLGQGHALPFVADDLFINYDDKRSKAGLEALAKLSEKTQVIFLSHHDHLVPTVKSVFGVDVNIINL